MNRTPFFLTVVAGLALTVACNKKDAPDNFASTGDYQQTEAGGDEDEVAAEGGEKVEETKTVETASTTRRGDAGGRTTVDATTVADADPMPEAEPEEPMPIEEDEESEDWDDAGADGVAMSAPAKAPALRIQTRPSRDKRKKESSSGLVGLGAVGSGNGSGGLAIGGGSVASDEAYGAPVQPHAQLERAIQPPPVTEIPKDLIADNEDYTDYGINDFTITTKDALSTFAVDVDTASYAITRSKLNSGYLPSQSAVRVEEFVNYFDYEYKQPAKGDPFTVDFEASPSPYNSRNTLVRVGVQGKRVAYDSRKPVHLTFLVDVSGSMQSANKIGLLKKTLTMLTEELEDGDTVAIATYAGRTEIVLEPTPMSKKQDIIRALNRLSAGGSTAMSSGIDLAYRLSDATFKEGSVNRVIVCSDGDANVGPASHTAISEQIKGYAAKGITLTTVGFGNGNYKDTMMERLANDGDGNYFYIDTEAEARRVFVDKLTGTLEVIAKDVKIQVEWNPEEVVAYRLIGYENRDVADKDFRNDAVDAGEIGAGHQVTAIYELALADDASGQLGMVRVRNKAPGPESPAVERAFGLDSSAIRPTFAETSDQYRIAVASAGFAEILRGSPHMQEVSLRDVHAIAKGAQRAEYNADSELVALIDRAAQLKGEGTYTAR